MRLNTVLAAGWVASAFLGWLLLGAKQDLGEAIEQCNSEKLAAVAEAERVLRVAQQEATDLKVLDLQRLLKKEREAVSLATMARDDARSDSAKAQELIRQLTKEATDESAPIEQACLAVTVPADITDSLR